MGKTVKKRLIIIGGGFGGLEAAKALAHADVEILLVDRRNYHLFQPLLYQVAMAGLSPAEIASPIRAILAEQKNLRVVLGDVNKVDVATKTIFVGKENEAETYDWLILAVGAQNGFFGHDEWEKFAPGMKSVEDALEIRRRVLLAFEEAENTHDPAERERLLTFCVVGGGPTGVEMSGAIAELSHSVLSSDFREADPRRAKVILVEGGPRILTMFPADLAQSAVDQLHEIGVEVKTGARVVNIDRHGVELQAGDVKTRVDASTVIWGAGVRASDLVKTLGVPLDKQGRVIVGNDCAIAEHPEVFAIGDVAHFEEKGEILPGVSPVAMQQGRYVAKLIRWESEERGAPRTRGGMPSLPPRTPFSYFDKGSMATIGRSRAIAYARGIKMHGFIAWLAWLFIHIFYLIGFKNRTTVLWTWTWSYLLYKRGARLITSTGWKPSQGGHFLQGSSAGSATPTPPSPSAVVVPSSPVASALSGTSSTSSMRANL